jgi:glyoxylase-like metal-dependent hydrolase (beta-lactamase superfamily II)
VTLLASREEGSFTSSNSLVVAGSEATVLVDPSIEVTRRGLTVGSIDLIVVSHGHEDHVAGLHVFPEAPAYAHPADAAAVRDPEALVSHSAWTGRRQDGSGRTCRTCSRSPRTPTSGDSRRRRHRPGGRTLTVVHLPGRTAGHCGLLVEPDGALFRR